MSNKKDRAFYDKVIISRFEPIYDFLLPLFSMTMVAVGITNLIVDANYFYFTLRIMMSIVFLVFYFLRKKIPTTFRVVSGTAIFLLIAFLRIYSSGITVVSLVILILIVIATVFFLPKIYRYIYTGVIILFLISIPIVNNISLNQSPSNYDFIHYNMPEYFSAFLGFSLVSLMILLSFNHLTRIHIEIIKDLEKQMVLTDEKANLITRLAHYDSLTGLPNKIQFQKEIEPFLPNTVSQLALIDIRDFEMINSLQGFDIGESILTKLGEELFELQSRTIKVARTNGNEFAFYFQNMTEPEIVDFLSDKLDAFNKKYFSEIGFKKLKFYIALIPLTELDIDFHKIYDKAIITLRNCKDNPNQKYILYDSSMIEKAQETDRISIIIENEIEKDGFEVFYQAKVDSISEKIVGVEALSRLKLENGDYVSPAIFIPIIEKSNQVVPFGELIITKVFQDYNKLMDKYGEHISVSINISPTHLLAENFISFLEELSEKYTIKTDSVTLEITEEVFIADSIEVKKILLQIKALGFKISIDDFGSGYSSLKYIAELPLNEVKIDQSFTKQILHNKKTELMLNVIFDMAKIMDFLIVVEGVETKEQLDLLKNIGTCEIQGFYFSFPSKL